jgi:transcriptional regulator with XRE-family HTH domain
MTVQASRLREAREFLGFTDAQVTKALGLPPGRLQALESGGGPVTGQELRRLSRLYTRPVPWFSGESSFQPSPALLRKVERMPEHDREAMLDFAEWLQGAGPAPAPRRVRP